MFQLDLLGLWVPEDQEPQELPEVLRSRSDRAVQALSVPLDQLLLLDQGYP